MSDSAMREQVPEQTGARHAFLVAAGILLSRLLGLVRQRVFAHYLGNSLAAAAFSAAMRIPNYLQNLFGEGVLSASFIPVYAQLLGQKDREQADRVAGAVFAILFLVTSVLVATGLLLTPWLVRVLAPGMSGDARALTITLVRILFPGTGLLVMSAWCLGVLNSHRRFFLSYAAPVVWNGAILAALWAFGGRTSQPQLAEWVAWGVVVGSLLQFGVQLPPVFGLLKSFRPVPNWSLGPVRQVVRSFLPAVVSRGVVQLSAYVDLIYASIISERAIAALTYAQALYLLPVSLFGMSVSAAELPAMSQESVASLEKLRERLVQALSRVAFFVVPSAIAFLLLGDVVAGALLQTGQFTPDDTRYVWFLLMGSSVGLLASTLGRVYSSAFYAFKDTRTPLRFAMLRVGLGAVLALWAVTQGATAWGLPREYSAVGITAASGIAAWVEYHLLRASLSRRLGRCSLPGRRLWVLWGCGVLAAVGALCVKAGLSLRLGADPRLVGAIGPSWLLPPHLHPVWSAAAILTPFGVLYFLLSFWAGVPQAKSVLGRIGLTGS